MDAQFRQELIELLGEAFDRKFDAAFDRKFDAAFDRKFDAAFDRKFDEAFDRKVDQKIEPLIDRKLDGKFGAFIEHIDDKFDGLTEAVQSTLEIVSSLPTRAEFNDLGAEVATIRYAVTDTNRELHGL